MEDTKEAKGAEEATKEAEEATKEAEPASEPAPEGPAPEGPPPGAWFTAMPNLQNGWMCYIK